MNEFYAYVKKTKNLKDADIIPVGYSIGTAMAVEFASERDTDNVILLGAFPSRYELSRTTYGFYIQKLFFLPNTFLTAQKIPFIRKPILFVHGNEDEVIPIAFGKQLFRIAPKDSSFIEVDNHGHNGLLEDYSHTLSIAFKTFIEK